MITTGPAGVWVRRSGPEIQPFGGFAGSGNGYAGWWYFEASGDGGQGHQIRDGERTPS